MTNKTELLPCPFCGSRGIPQIHSKVEYAFVDHDDFCPMAGSLPTLDKWNTRATPAEDVREVVEEPAAWANGQQLLLCSNSKLDVGHPNPLYHQLPRQIAGSALPTEYCDTPLYRHPQHKVVMPERMDLRSCDGSQTYETKAWNACLDEFARLNK